MQKRCFLILGMLLGIMMIWGQGTETFENHNAPSSSYGDGDYVGDNSITWNYEKCRSEDIYGITNKGIMLRNLGQGSRVYSEPISGGIGSFSVQMKKGFTGSGNRQLALYINNVHKADSETFDDTNVHTFSVNNINISGNIVIEIRNIQGNGTTNRQCVIDNLSWTSYSGIGIPVATDATAISRSSFTANWNAVTGATGYYLDVYKEAAGFATDLFISEYIEGTSYNKAIEIYNGTGASVDLSDYTINKQANGAGDFGGNFALTGTLHPGSVHVVAHSSANATILAKANQTTGGTPLDFNGNDCVALYKSDTMIDVVGVINQTSNWGADITLVRKSSISSPSTTYNTGDWDSYPTDTLTYLGSHTFDGAAFDYVDGFENKNVENVTSYELTGLDANTTYYYVVRAYDEYSQTSASSNEIEVTTYEYDIPEDIETVVAQGVSIIIEGGSANIVDGQIPPIPNVDFESSFAIILDVTGEGPWAFLITSDAPWGAYYTDDSWHKIENEGGGFLFEIESSDDGLLLPIVLGDQDATLPVELSAFHVRLNNKNQALITWVSETETAMIGYYIYRSSEDDLENALRISELIPATNTSQQQIYVYTDTELEGAGKYYYWLQTADMDGTVDFHGPIYLHFEGGGIDNPGAPLITRLNSVYPNPFNPDTTIHFSLKETQQVQIRIYNTRGQLIRTLENTEKNAGHYRLNWDGKNDQGQSLGTGVYFIRMDVGAKSFSKKAVMMK